MIADKIKNARTILYYITIIIVGIICTYNLLNVTLSLRNQKQDIFVNVTLSIPKTNNCLPKTNNFRCWSFFYAFQLVFLKLSVTFIKLIQ